MTNLQKMDSEKFNLFVFSIDDTLDKLETLGERHSFNLNLSPESLNDLECFILEMNFSISNTLEINELAQYLGEVVRKAYGGKWILGDNPQSELDFGQPVVSGFNDIGFVFNPLIIIRNFIIHKQSGVLIRAFNAQKGHDRLAHLKAE